MVGLAQFVTSNKDYSLAKLSPDHRAVLFGTCPHARWPALGHRQVTKLCAVKRDPQERSSGVTWSLHPKPLLLVACPKSCLSNLCTPCYTLLLPHRMRQKSSTPVWD